jgi:hypothetical protein
MVVIHVHLQLSTTAVTATAPTIAYAVVRTEPAPPLPAVSINVDMPRRPADPIDMTGMKVLSTDDKVRLPFNVHKPALQYYVCSRVGVRVCLCRWCDSHDGAPVCTWLSQCDTRTLAAFCVMFEADKKKQGESSACPFQTSCSACVRAPGRHQPRTSRFILCTGTFDVRRGRDRPPTSRRHDECAERLIRPAA